MSDLIVYTPEECEQGSEAWRSARLGIPTASKFSDVLAKGQGITRKKYLYQLAGEILTGQPTEGYSNAHMERGTAMEPEARREYAWKKGVDPVAVGFMRRGDAGASPDSLIGDDGILEIKTKLPHLQIECLLAGKVPSEHLAQIHGQLWISGRAWADFVSYWPGLPLFVTRVERDEAYIQNLAAEVAAFNADLAAMVATIRAME